MNGHIPLVLHRPSTSLPRWSRAQHIVPHGAHKPATCNILTQRQSGVGVSVGRQKIWWPHQLTDNEFINLHRKQRTGAILWPYVLCYSWMGSTERISSEESSLGTLVFIMQLYKWVSVSDHTICLWQCVVGVLNRILRCESSYVVGKQMFWV